MDGYQSWSNGADCKYVEFCARMREFILNNGFDLLNNCNYSI